MQYDEYLELNQLLKLKSPALNDNSPFINDELFFITLHQTQELWFQQILHDIDAILSIFATKRIIDGYNLDQIINLLKRISQIINQLASNLSILNSLDPLRFLEFRHLLIPATGLHSRQFKHIQNKLTQFTCYMGAKEEDGKPTLLFYIEHWLTEIECQFEFTQNIEEYYLKPFDAWIKESKTHLIQRTDLQECTKELSLNQLIIHQEYCKKMISEEYYQELLFAKNVSLSYSSFITILMLTLYKNHPKFQLYYQVINQLTEINEALSKWHINHAINIRKLIGNTLGTGGKYNVPQLMQKKTSVFEELCDINTLLIPTSKLPQLKISQN